MSKTARKVIIRKEIVVPDNAMVFVADHLADNELVNRVIGADITDYTITIEVEYERIQGEPSPLHYIYEIIREHSDDDIDDDDDDE